jgi:hypothetical protein
MRKFYYSAISALTLIPYNMSAQSTSSVNGSVIIKLNNSENNNKPVDSAYIILDRFDLTGAGVVREKYFLIDNNILLENLPVGKYYADIYINGLYSEHFSRIIKVTPKGKIYAFKLSEVGFYNANTSLIPKESDDYSRTSVVFMK